MKKFLGVLLFVLSLVTFVNAQGTLAVSSTGYAWDSDMFIELHAANDTVVKVDTVILFDTTSFPRGKFYELVKNPITGVDSCELILVLQCFGMNGNTLIERVVVDTIVSQLGEQIVLPIHKTKAFNRFRLLAIGGALNGSKTIWQGGYVNYLVPAIPVGKSRFTN